MTELNPVNDEGPAEPAGPVKTPEWWEADGVPDTASAESLYHRNEHGAKVFAPPTHYHHLADGRVVVGYSGGTQVSEPDGNGGERIVPIIGIYQG